MRVRCCAKINLILEIIGKREDGFHELRTIMQAVSLCDGLLINRRTALGISFECDSADVAGGSDNLVVKAAECFFREIGEPGSVDIVLSKRIPVSAGLGGGSSDAAATLKCLNTLWGEPLSRIRILQMAAQLGSDVPFFIEGGTALATGRGDIITPLPFIGNMPVLLMNPGFAVPTAMVYSSVKLHLTSPRSVLNILPVLTAGGITGMELVRHVRNDLQGTVLNLYPEIRDMLEWMSGQGADTVGVSGSGGTVFGLFLDSDRASGVAREAEKQFPWVYLANTVSGTG
jgi:4-diphosphocytidyl-2-C-methyl-D-erythritol kinase